MGKAARREAASLLSTADRRMSKVRPGCVSAIPQSMRSLSKRQTHFDRLVEDGAQGALRPSCPADEAINPNRQTGSQRKERSTPTVRRVSSGRSDQLQSPDGCPAGEGPTSNSNRRTWTEDGELRQIRRFDPRCLRRTNVNSASAAVPSWETGGERIILRSYPCNRDHAPRFLWSEPLEKAKQ